MWKNLAVWLLLLLPVISGCAARPSTPVPPAAFIRTYILPGQLPRKLPDVKTKDGHVVYSFCKSMDWAVTMAYNEAARRFVNPVVVMCHGGDDPDTHRWTAFADADRGGEMVVEDMAKELARRFPDRDIVLDICNDGAEKLDVPRVWYFREQVWVMPDAVYMAQHAGDTPIDKFWALINGHLAKKRGTGPAGSIWEAVTQTSTTGYEAKHQ